MASEELRALWTAPRPPGAPARVWRDWVLVGAGLCGMAVELALRDDVKWPPVAALLGALMLAALLWRRTHPLATMLVLFGATILVQLAAQVLTGRGAVGLDDAVLGLVLIYSLFRWGAGSEILIGGAVVLLALVVSVATDGFSLAELFGGLTVLMLVAAPGMSVRLWTAARERQVQRARSLERERLARELHDTVAHHVSAMVIRAQAGRVVAGTDPAGAVEALVGVEEEGARTLEEMRAMVSALRGQDGEPGLAPRAGVADLPRLARAPAGRLHVDLVLDGELAELPPALDAAIYRIVQESVTNTMRHADGASRVEVRVEGDPAWVRVTVTDDGRRPGPARAGFGLIGLRERAELLGGWLLGGPGAERGWRVEAELPRGRG